VTDQNTALEKIDELLDDVCALTMPKGALGAADMRKKINAKCTEILTVATAALTQTAQAEPADKGGGDLDLDQLLYRTDALGKWMSAALDDPKVCKEMKADIQSWFNAQEPYQGRLSPHPPEVSAQADKLLAAERGISDGKTLVIEQLERRIKELEADKGDDAGVDVEALAKVMFDACSPGGEFLTGTQKHRDWKWRQYREQYTRMAQAVSGHLTSRNLLKTNPHQSVPEGFQSRVKPWMDACFGAEISADKIERNHRFLEEAIELVQANGCTQSEAHQLVDYVYGRPVGEINQEVGGVMVTLAALCLANGIDMHEGGETELKRIWTKVDQIRAKQAAKPKHSPLPAAPTPAVTDLAEVAEESEIEWLLPAAIEAVSESLVNDIGELDPDHLRLLIKAANFARAHLETIRGKAK